MTRYRGVLAPIASQGGIFGAIRRQAAEQVFLTLLDRCWAQGVYVSQPECRQLRAQGVRSAGGSGRLRQTGFRRRHGAAYQADTVEDYRRRGRHGAQRISRQAEG